MWGKQDPKTALERAQMTKPELRGLYTAAVLAGWEESDQPAVLEYVEAMPPGHDRQRAIQVVARRKVLRDGPAAAFEWAEGLDEGDELFKLNVIRRVASSAAEVQPQHAARWAEKLLGGDFESGIPQRVGTRWAKRDPIAAMDWLSTLAPGRGRDDGVRETFRKWLRWDDEAAMDWANGVKLEPWLDPVISIVAKRLSKEDPLLALDWASRVHDEPLRLATTGVVARVWVIRDEPKASEWIAQADLPAYLKRKIFEIPEMMQPGFMKRVREKGLAEARREFAAERRAAGAQPK